MPSLHWIGKEKVVHHHLDVPYHVLEHSYSFDEGNVSQEMGDSGNKIIHGDNLLALKSLLPQYEGKVNCIYIDPPYNTGNEGWVYNDNVNDPKIKKWLGEVVGKEAEDLTRHDKWLCMMYPRLKLLHKLLAEDGVIFISIDDNEVAHLKVLMDEIFGPSNFVANIIWERSFSPVNLKKHFSENHDFIVCFAKNFSLALNNGLQRSIDADNRYKNPDNDYRGVWTSSDMTVGPVVESKLYEIRTPSGKIMSPSNGRCWLFTEEKYIEMLADNRIWFGEKGDNMPRVKKFLSEVKNTITPQTIWKYTEVGHSQDATQSLKKIFNGQSQFDYPKPVELVGRCLELYSSPNSIILDSFAGSGTTAHAVLNLNKKDGGNRKFILVEMEDYADTITAERVKRVINGYADVEGTGGGFSFYTLGLPLFTDDGLLNEAIGEEKIREYIYFTETQQQCTQSTNVNRFFLGMANDSSYYFYYIPDQVTTLNAEFLATISLKSSQYVIYADTCALDEVTLLKNSIIFKKIPRDITRI